MLHFALPCVRCLVMDEVPREIIVRGSEVENVDGKYILLSRFINCKPAYKLGNGRNSTFLFFDGAWIIGHSSCVGRTSIMHLMDCGLADPCEPYPAMWKRTSTNRSCFLMRVYNAAFEEESQLPRFLEGRVTSSSVKRRSRDEVRETMITQDDISLAVKRARVDVNEAIVASASGADGLMRKLKNKLREICPSAFDCEIDEALNDPFFTMEYILPNDHVVSMELRCGTSDFQSCKEVFVREDYKRLFSNRPKGDTIVFDLGGYIADSALYSLASLIEADVNHHRHKVVIFECDGENAQRARINLRKNQIWYTENMYVLLEKAAVCSSADTVTFNASESKYNCYRNSCSHKTACKTKSVIVPATNIFDEIGKHCAGASYEHVLMKVDVEGGEFELLDQLEKLVEVVRGTGARSFRLVLEYSLDLDDCLENWRARKKFAGSVFREVWTKRKFEDGQLTFSADPGDLGIEMTFHSGVVTRVALGGQAHNWGVKPGWQLVAIDGSRLDRGVTTLLKSLEAGSRSYNVTFQRDKRFISFGSCNADIWCLSITWGL